MTCDNLPHNGKVVRGVVLDLARLIDPALADWIEREGRFLHHGGPHRPGDQAGRHRAPVRRHRPQ
ncbi:hypothetical protein V6L77_13955 [Pannonibacter sp. Pt2-lr]